MRIPLYMYVYIITKKSQEREDRYKNGYSLFLGERERDPFRIPDWIACSNYR